MNLVFNNSMIKSNLIKKIPRYSRLCVQFPAIIGSLCTSDELENPYNCTFPNMLDNCPDV